MMSIIVVQNGASSASLHKSVEAARSTGLKDLIVVAPQATLAGLADITGINSDQTLRSALAAALDKASGSHILIVDSRLAPSNHELQAAIGAVSQNKSADYVCASLKRGGDIIGSEDLNLDNMVEVLASNPEWPLLCVGMRKESARQTAPLEGETLSEIIVQLLVKGTIRGQLVESTSYSLQLSTTAEIGSLRLSGEALARILRSATALCNIEDLFPSHPWDNHEEESAAAAYHELAALFVRFGDLDAAADCLKISDQFEDSPRSLALKAMIAKLRGETLGAVANMVASLQQYEIRKHDNNKHYVRFTPGNVEKITDNLQAGLTALNREDNETALQCFSQAVFNFDPFFKEYGLEK